MNYSIGEFSKIVHLGIHTLRYYEQENLIRPERDMKNRRRYSEGDIAWISFIKRLKDTGMPIKKIKRYAMLREAGDSTLTNRMEMLMEHREMLAGQIGLLKEHKNRLDEKIEGYRREIMRTENGTVIS